MAEIDNDKIKKLMGMLSSDNDNEALTAARKLVDELTKGGVHPSEAMIHTQKTDPKKKTPRGAKDQEIAWLERKVERLQAEVDDVKKDRDWWKDQYDHASGSASKLTEIMTRLTDKWTKTHDAAESWMAEAKRLQAELDKKGKS